MCQQNNKIHLLYLSALVCLFLVAVPVSALGDFMAADNVRAAVLTWVGHYAESDDRNPDIASIEAIENGHGDTIAWIVHFLDKGFCLCSADNRLLPVYYYSPGGKFSPDDPLCASIINNIESQLVKFETEDDKLLSNEFAERAEFWDALIAGQFPVKIIVLKSDTVPSRLVLPFTSLWHQRSPYNQMCPELSPGEHTVVGCGPLSMAQLMYYWQWPSRGEGSRSMEDVYRYSDQWISTTLPGDPGIPPGYPWDGRLDWQNDTLSMKGYWDATLLNKAIQDVCDGIAYSYCGIAVSKLFYDLTVITKYYDVVFSDQTYDWSVMHDVHDDYTSGNNEVAKLCFHSGVAMGAWWGLYETSRGSVGADINALETYFRYAKGFGLVMDDDEPDIIDNEIIEEINWSRPIIMCGAGHCFNVFGYDTSGPATLLMINNGWGSSGWYTLDAWASGRQYSVKLFPENVKFVQEGESLSGDGSPDSPYIGLERAVSEAPDNSTLVLRAQESFTINEINGPLILKGMNVLITSH